MLTECDDKKGRGRNCLSGSGVSERKQCESVTWNCVACSSRNWQKHAVRFTWSKQRATNFRRRLKIYPRWITQRWESNTNTEQPWSESGALLVVSCCVHQGLTCVSHSGSFRFSPCMHSDQGAQNKKRKNNKTETKKPQTTQKQNTETCVFRVNNIKSEDSSASDASYLLPYCCLVILHCCVSHACLPRTCNMTD